MKKALLLLVISILTLARIFAAEDDHTIWGSAAYTLSGNRVEEGFESLLNEAAANVSEVDRWLLGQSLYLNLKYRYRHLLELELDSYSYLSNSNFTELQLNIDQLYLKTNITSWLSASFGKMNIDWGTNRVLRAYDKLQISSNPSLLSSSKNNIVGIKLLMLPTYWNSITVLLIPTNELRWSNFAVRLDLLLLDTDIGFSVIKYTFNHLAGVSLVSDAVLLELEKKDRYAILFDLIRYFNNFGIFAECEIRNSKENGYGFYSAEGDYQLQNSSPLDELVIKAAGGLSYEMETAPYLRTRFEYLYNGEGFTPTEAQRFYFRYLYHTENAPESLSPVYNSGSLDFGSFRQHYLSLELSNAEIIKHYLTAYLQLNSNIETWLCSINLGLDINLKNQVNLGLNYNQYLQFTDRDDNPSEVNFIGSNYKLKFAISIDY